ncbi:MAG TPA: hypothetical protein VL068_02640 [Microthrixaceae bacterium]|nr:hypothetical protein [Microthrixaceae bacterium]
MKKAPRHGGSPVWRKPRRVVRLLAVLAVMAIVSVGLETSPVSAAPQNKVLILTESVRNGASSVEATHLASLGFADEAAILAKIPRGEGQRIFRAIEPDELADLADLGAFRTVAGLEGKYFWPTQAQAGEFAEMMTKRGMGGAVLHRLWVHPGTSSASDRGRSDGWTGFGVLHPGGVPAAHRQHPDPRWVAGCEGIGYSSVDVLSTPPRAV